MQNNTVLEELSKVISKATKFLPFILPIKGVHSWLLSFGDKIQHGEKQLKYSVGRNK